MYELTLDARTEYEEEIETLLLIKTFLCGTDLMLFLNIIKVDLFYGLSKAVNNIALK